MEFQTITRKGSFDAAHRILNEKIKCFNLHGHTFLYELTFAFEEPEDLGYALDFKEIKRVACQYIDDVWDHSMIANPMDTDVIDVCRKLGTKLNVMSLYGPDTYCNPTAESISKELFILLGMLMDTDNLWLYKIRLYETPNCWVDTTLECLKPSEIARVAEARGTEIIEYRKKKGTFEYDDRK